MSAEAVPYVRRLMLALDAGRCCADDVSLAVELAAALGAELEGLFVEDSDLMDLALLPFAREVGGRSGQDRPLVRASMESLLRRRIERTVGALERASRQRNVPVSHKTARGKVIHQALAQGSSRDVLLLNPRALVPMARSHSAGPVMVWYDGHAAGACLDLAVQLACRLNSELVVGIPDERFVTERDVRLELAAWLARLPGRVRVRQVHGGQADGVIGAARATKVAQIVLDANGALATEQALEHMLSVLASRVILVR